ncbi:MAG: NADPH-dependent assimilatory sulfite reductase hemoprotein subunit [Pirellulales bacterium]
MSTQNKVSAVETVKEKSQFLRGAIPDELHDGTEKFGKDSVQLLKHHGIYQQDNRDERGKSDPTPAGKSSRATSFMVRTKLPGGKLTSPQLLAELDLCDEIANGTLRITDRQGLQLHGVLKDDLQRTLRRINEVHMSTLAACGDVERNVMCTPVPYTNRPEYRAMQELADRLAEHLCPRTRSYYQVWLRDEETGERQLVDDGRPADEVEPIYGAHYLPRKFKTAIGLPGDNSVDLYAQDLGLMAICAGEGSQRRIVGYNMLVGGGFGVTPSAAKTYPALAQPMAFVTPEQVVDVSTEVIKVQRDYGNREDRKVARLKYTIANMGGIGAFKKKVEEYYGAALPDPKPVPVTDYDDCMGWREQGDGRWFYGLNVENGRVKDEGEFRLKTALRQICHELQPTIRLTPHQSLLFCDVAPESRGRLEELLRSHGVPLTEEISTVRRWSIACPALPTCGLAITESERALPGIIDQLEPILAELGLQNERFTVRMTGCPNGCARPYNSDIGLVGKTKGKYTLFVGGRVEGDRLNFIHRDLVADEQVVPMIGALLAHFQAHRLPGESFGDFCHRQGNDALLPVTEHLATDEE